MTQDKSPGQQKQNLSMLAWRSMNAFERRMFLSTFNNNCFNGAALAILKIYLRLFHNNTIIFALGNKHRIRESSFKSL